MKYRISVTTFRAVKIFSRAAPDSREPVALVIGETPLTSTGQSVFLACSRQLNDRSTDRCRMESWSGDQAPASSGQDVQVGDLPDPDIGISVTAFPGSAIFSMAVPDPEVPVAPVNSGISSHKVRAVDFSHLLSPAERPVDRPQNEIPVRRAKLQPIRRRPTQRGESLESRSQLFRAVKFFSMAAS